MPPRHRSFVGAASLSLLCACLGPVSTPTRSPRLDDKVALPAPFVRAAATLKASATVALARDGDRTIAYVADEDGGAVLTVDVERGEPMRRMPVDGRPSSVLFGDDGRQLRFHRPPQSGQAVMSTAKTRRRSQGQG